MVRRALALVALCFTCGAGCTLCIDLDGLAQPDAATTVGGAGATAQGGGASTGGASASSSNGDGGASGGSGGGGGGGAPSDYTTEVLADQPAGYWRLGDATVGVAADASGHAADGQYLGGVTVGALGAIAGPDTAAHFDGNPASKVLVGDQFDFPAQTAFSVEAWIRSESTITDSYARRVVAKVTAGPQSEGYQLFVQYGTVKFQRVALASSDDVGAPLPPNAYAHVVVAYDGSILHLFINGQPAGAVQGTVSMADTTADFAIGPNFDGDIDEVAVYPVALAPERVLAHYQAGTGAAQ